MEQRPWRVAVVGGGLSGLAALHRLWELCSERRRPAELTLLESESRPGGVVQTQHFGGYLVESGADSFLTEKPWAVDLCRRLNLENHLIPTNSRYRRSLVLRRSRPVPVPKGFLLMAPSRIWPIVTSPVLSVRGKLRLALECVIPRRLSDGDESLGHFVRRRLGREAFERLVQPLVAGIYTADPDTLSLKATLPRFLEMERRYGSLIRAFHKTGRGRPGIGSYSSGARYEMFATLSGGVSMLTDALVSKLQGEARLRMNSTVRRVTREPGTNEFQLRMDRGGTERFDAVLVAVPAYRAAELLDALAPRLAGALRSIPYASSAIVATGHKLADIRHPLDAFGLVVPAIEGHNILAVSFASRKFPNRAPEGRIQLRTFVGGALQAKLLDRSDEQLVTIVRQELAEILAVSGSPEFTLVFRWNRSMPQYNVGHLDLVERIEKEAAQHPALALAGNAYRGVGIPDCIHSGEEAAERLFNLDPATGCRPAR